MDGFTSPGNVPCEDEEGEATYLTIYWRLLTLKPKPHTVAPIASSASHRNKSVRVLVQGPISGEGVEEERA